MFEPEHTQPEKSAGSLEAAVCVGSVLGHPEVLRLAADLGSPTRMSSHFPVHHDLQLQREALDYDPLLGVAVDRWTGKSLDILLYSGRRGALLCVCGSKFKSKILPTL
jgi:hypothetical protein